MKALLAVLFLLSALPTAYCAGKFSADSREFGKRVGYRLTVDYAETGGLGPARFTLRDPAGKTVSVFEEERAPFTVTISGDGKRLIAFNGWWGQTVSITNICVYSSDGKLLQKHKLSMEGPAGEDFSSDLGVYSIGANRDGAGAVYVLSTSDGKLLWSRAFKEKLNGVKLSGDGKRLLIVLLAGEKKYRAALFDEAGEQCWEKVFSTRNNIFPRSVNGDGSEFQLWEDRLIYKQADGYYHDTVLLKRSFRASSSGVREIKAETVREEVK